MNPYDAIHKQGFLKIDELNGVFVLQRGINDLSVNEIKGLLDLIQKKLQLYYTKIGSEALPRENGPFLLSVPETDNKDELLDDTDKAHFIPNIVAPKTPETPILAYTLEDLGLSNRAYNSLRRNGICTTAALFEAVSTGMVRKFKNIGAMTVDELERIVESLKNNTFIPGMPAAANCGSDNGIALDIDSTVADFYPENSFKLFRQYCNDHPQVKDRRYAKGILVKNTQNITAYDQLIAKILSDAGFQTLSPGQLLSFLQIHQLAFKIIPKELEVSKYFEVSEEQFTLIQAQEG